MRLPVAFGDFLAEIHVVEAGFDIEDADAFRVELEGPDTALIFSVSAKSV